MIREVLDRQFVSKHLDLVLDDLKKRLPALRRVIRSVVGWKICRLRRPRILQSH